MTMTTMTIPEWLEFICRCASADRPFQERVTRTLMQIVVGLTTGKLFPQPRVNALACLFWQLVGSRVTPCVMGDAALPGLDLMTVIRPLGRSAGVILVPPTWPADVARNPIPHVGAAAFVASLARDFWSRPHASDPLPLARARAFAYQAEALRLLQSVGCALTEDDNRVLCQNPGGLAGCEDYDPPAFDMIRARAEFESFKIGTAIREPSPCPTIP